LTTASGPNETEQSILGSGWRQFGFDVSETILPSAQAQDGQARSSFPGLFTFSVPLGEITLAAAGTAGNSGPENRWTGRNRGGWSNPEFDRIAEAFTVTLDPSQRVQQIAQMVRVFSDDLPAISMYFNAIPLAHTSALKGPGNVAQQAEVAWNIYEWELQ
jgi:peptide/nickel transport system substrate-binding protein